MREIEENKKGVVLLSHIPNGFFEPQMYDFFSQFGDVTRMKLIRSKKTGRSRHFAFIEFQFEEVAKIVADTMDNYLMFRKILKCKLIPSEDLRSRTFRNWRSMYRFPKTRRIAIKEHNADTTDPIKIEFKQKKTKAKRDNLQKKLADLGIEYDIFNIKVNESFVPPKRARASPDDVAEANAPLSEYTGERFSEFDISEDENEEENQNDVSETLEQNQASTNQDEVSETSEQDMTPTIAEEDKDDGKLVQTESQHDKVEDFGVMIVDLEDPEVTFKSPPTESRIKRKSIGVPKLPEEFVQTPKRAREKEQHTKMDETPKQRRLKKLKQLEQALESSDEDDDTKESESKKLANTCVKRKSKSRVKNPKTKKGKLNRTM